MQEWIVTEIYLKEIGKKWFPNRLVGEWSITNSEQVCRSVIDND